MGLVSRKEGKNSPKNTAPVGVGMGFTLNSHDMYEVGLSQDPRPQTLNPYNSHTHEVALSINPRP